MRFWTWMSGFASAVVLGAIAQGDGWGAVFFSGMALFCWLAPRGWPPEDGIASFRAARKALRGGR